MEVDFTHFVNKIFILECDECKSCEWKKGNYQDCLTSVSRNTTLNNRKLFQVQQNDDDARSLFFLFHLGCFFLLYSFPKLNMELSVTGKRDYACLRLAS